MAGSVSTTASISWSPASLTQDVKPGETKTVIASLTTRSGTPGGVLRVVPALQSLVTVSPTTIGPLSPNQSVQVTVTFHAPIDALPADATGTVQLREADGSNNAIAKPLPVTVHVIWPKTEELPSGISFSYPTFGYINGRVVPQEPITDGTTSWTVYDLDFATPDLMSTITLYHLTVLSNTQSSSLTAWFSANIDPDGILSAAGSFQLKQLPNGFQVLVLVGQIPPEFAADNGPIDGIFAMSPSTKTVFIVGKTLADIAPLTYGQMQTSFLTMLGTMQAP